MKRENGGAGERGSEEWANERTGGEIYAKAQRRREEKNERTGKRESMDCYKHVAPLGL